MTNDLQQGKLEQTCPFCGRTEAASHYCTKCLHPMGPTNWYYNGDGESRLAALRNAPQKSSLGDKRPRGRPRVSEAA